jgi:murein DD-endopeptidase MepM/ murein hydrolase activator NlpD
MRGDMQPLERDLAHMRAIIAEMEKRGTKIPAPNIPPPPPETKRSYEDLIRTVEELRRSVELNEDSFRQMSQSMAAAGTVAGSASGGNGFGGAATTLLSMAAVTARLLPMLAELESVQGVLTGAALKFGLVSKSIPLLGAAAAAAAPVLGGLGKVALSLIPGLGQLGLAAMGLNAIFGVMATGARAAMAPLVELSSEAGRLNKQVAEAGIFAAQSFAILGPDNKLVEGTARQMQIVRGAILKEYQGIQREVANISGATASQIYDGFNIILQNVSALGDKGTLENSAKLATRLAAGMNTLGIPGYQLRQEVNALMMGNIDRNAMMATKLGITGEDARQQQAQGTYYDFLMKKLEKLYDGQKVLALSLANVKSNFDDVNEAIASQSGQPLERDTAQMMQTILVTFKNLQQSFAGFFQSIAEAVGPILKLLGPVVSVLTSIGAIASSVGRVIMDVVGTATAALGSVLQPVLVTIARFVELLAKGTENLASAIGGAINPIKALFNAGTDANVDGVNSFFDNVIKGAEASGKAIDEWNKKWAQTVLNNRLANMRENMKAAGASEKEITDAQINFRENFNRQTGLTEAVELRSLQLDPKSKTYLEELNARLGTGSTRALNITKAWADIKQKAYQNEIKSLEQGLTLMNKQREMAEAMSAVAAARRALVARGYELGVQVAASPEARMAAEARLADLKLSQEREAIAERRGILQTERELQERQMLIQQTQIKIQQEQLKIQVAEALADQVRVDEATKAALKARGNTTPRSSEWAGFTRELNVLAAEGTRNAARLAGAREALRLAFAAEGQLGTINGLEAQRISLQEQQLDIQGQSAQYTREQQALLAQISAAEQKIANELTRATNKENERKEKLEAQTAEINRQLKLQEQQGRLEKARAELAITRAKAEVQAAQRLAEVQAAQDRARNGGGTASVIEAQIAAAAAGVSGMENAAEAQKRLYAAREQQMQREHQLQTRQLEVQQMRENSEVRIQELRLRGEQVALVIEKARTMAEIARLGLSQQRDALSPQVAGASIVPALPGTPTGTTANILPGTKGGPNWNEGVGYGRGRLHAGQDLGTDPNDPVAARMNGVIEQAYAKGFGKAGGAVVIKYQDGSKGTYGHVNPLVAQGQSVSAGQLIARVTPDGNNSHLHYELRNARGHLDFNPGAAIRAGMAAGGRPAAAAVPASAIRATDLGGGFTLRTGGANIPPEVVAEALRKAQGAGQGGGGAAAGVSGGPVTSTANQEQDLLQALKDNNRVQGEVAEALKDLVGSRKTIGDAQVLERENLTEQQLAERAQFRYEQEKLRLTAEIMKTPQGQLGIATGDAVSGSISGSLSGALQALLSGGDVRQAVSGALAQAGQTLMQATLDALLNPLLSQLQGQIFKAISGVDINAAALQGAASAQQGAAATLTQAGGGLLAAANALMAAAGAGGAAAAGNAGSTWAGLAAKLPSLLGGFAGLGSFAAPAGAFSSITSVGFAAAPNLISGVGGFTPPAGAFTPGLAGGGDIQYGLDYLVGEKNAEIVRFNKAGGKVFSNRTLTQALGVPFQRAPGGGAAVADGNGSEGGPGIPFLKASGGGREAGPGIPFLKASGGGREAGPGIPFLKASGGVREASMVQPRPLRLIVETQVINQIEYATVQQLRESSAAAAQAGRDSLAFDMRNSPTFQRSVGMG